MFESYHGPRDTFALHDKRAFQLQADGIYHPRSNRSAISTFTPYEDVTHVAGTSRAIWLGTRRSVYVIPRKMFANETGPEDFARALFAILANRPGGDVQLAQMAEVDALARNPAPVITTWIFVAICIAVFALHLAVGERIWNVGYFSLPFVQDGDLWRLVTGNLLHGVPQFPLHMVLNLFALTALGNLVERVLGPARTACIMGLAGVAAMAAGGVAAPSALVGSSGIVFGLAAACLWLELYCTERLPAWLRIPRRSMFFFLGVNGILMLAIPFVSASAHIGGFLAGFVGTALLTGLDIGRATPGTAIRGLAALVAAITVAAVGAAGFVAFANPHFQADFNRRLAGLPNVSPFDLNDRAWTIAIDPDSSDQDRQAALEMAQRAVLETNRASPQILDTLAEILFQLGHPELAAETIREAIARAPRDSYYREQLRRFIGERGDRPDDSPFRRFEREEPHREWVPGPGLTV